MRDFYLSYRNKRNKIYFLCILLLVCVFFNLIFIEFASATDGYIAYRSNTGSSTTSSPKVRFWNSSAASGAGTWGNEVELATAGSPIRYLKIKQSPMDSKIVIVTESDDGNLDAYVCLHLCETPANWVVTNNIGLVWAAASNDRRFDIVFEKTNGNLMLVFGISDANIARDLAYWELTQATNDFSGIAVSYINDASANGGGDLQYSWVELDENPAAASNDLILTGFDSSGNDVNSWIWTAGAWGNRRELTAAATACGGRECIASRYAADGSDGMAVSATGTAGAFNWQYWNAGAWTSGSLDINGASNNDVGFITLRADPATDDMQLVDTEVQGVLWTAYWDGTATWTASASHDAGLDVNAQRCADFEWNPTGSTGKLVWDTDGAGATTLTEKNCAPQCNGATTNPTNYANAGRWITLFRNPTSADTVNILGLRLDALFDIGAFRWDGATFTLYADNTATADTTVATWEAYDFDYIRDTVGPVLTFQLPTPVSGDTQYNTSLSINISSNEYLQFANLEWNGTNVSMNFTSDTVWYFNETGLIDGFYTYKVYGTDLAGNTGNTTTRNITINTPPNITLVSPENNTLNDTSPIINFFYNVTDILDNVSKCSLLIDNVIVANTTTTPLNESKTQNFTFNLTDGQHNWSIWCNDTNRTNSTSEIRNITLDLKPKLHAITIEDYLTPAGEIILNAGLTRPVKCQIVISDPLGPTNIKNVTSKIYYYLNASSDPDSNLTKYSNATCSLNTSTSINATYDCYHTMYYYANNGTWYCNVTVFNNGSLSRLSYNSTIVDPIYSLNVTDGMNFGQVEAFNISSNITANVTNIGNMQINITVQGYARILWDNISMNCSDNTNMSAAAIHFSKSTLDFNFKTILNGSVQDLNLTLPKPINNTLAYNASYWQIQPDPGTSNRICRGNIVFEAIAS